MLATQAEKFLYDIYISACLIDYVFSFSPTSMPCLKEIAMTGKEPPFLNIGASGSNRVQHSSKEPVQNGPGWPTAIQSQQGNPVRPDERRSPGEKQPRARSGRGQITALQGSSSQLIVIMKCCLHQNFAHLKSTLNRTPSPPDSQARPALPSPLPCACKQLVMPGKRTSSIVFH